MAYSIFGDAQALYQSSYDQQKTISDPGILQPCIVTRRWQRRPGVVRSLMGCTIRRVRVRRLIC